MIKPKTLLLILVSSQMMCFLKLNGQNTTLKFKEVFIDVSIRKSTHEEYNMDARKYGSLSKIKHISKRTYYQYNLMDDEYEYARCVSFRNKKVNGIQSEIKIKDKSTRFSVASEKIESILIFFDSDKVNPLWNGHFSKVHKKELATEYYVRLITMDNDTMIMTQSNYEYSDCTDDVIKKNFSDELEDFFFDLIKTISKNKFKVKRHLKSCD